MLAPWTVYYPSHFHIPPLQHTEVSKCTQCTAAIKSCEKLELIFLTNLVRIQKETNCTKANEFSVRPNVHLSCWVIPHQCISIQPIRYSTHRPYFPFKYPMLRPSSFLLNSEGGSRLALREKEEKPPLLSLDKCNADNGQTDRREDRKEGEW